MNDDDPIDPALEALFEEARGVVSAVDPVPDDVVLAARSAFAHRDLDALLMELVDRESLSVRSDESATTMRFDVADATGAARSVEIRVSPDRDGFQLVGEVDPPGVRDARVVVDGDASPVDVVVDEDGLFTATVSGRRFRIELTWTDGSRSITSWIAP